jgi:hypothetical protein
MDDQQQRRRRDALCSQRPLPVVNQQRVRLGDTQYSLTESCRDLTAANARRPRAPSRRQQWVQALKNLSRGWEGSVTHIPSRAIVSASEDSNTLDKCHDFILLLYNDLRNLQLGVHFLTSRAAMRDFSDPAEALTHFQNDTGAKVRPRFNKKMFRMAYDVMSPH